MFKRRAVLDLLGFSPEEPTVTGGNGDDFGLVGVFLRLLDVPDRAVMDVIVIVMGETLASGSAAIEAVGGEIGVDMARYWQADDAFFECVRDDARVVHAGLDLARVLDGHGVGHVVAERCSLYTTTTRRQNVPSAESRPRAFRTYYNIWYSVEA